MIQKRSPIVEESGLQNKSAESSISKNLQIRTAQRLPSKKEPAEYNEKTDNLLGNLIEKLKNMEVRDFNLKETK